MKNKIMRLLALALAASLATGITAMAEAPAAADIEWPEYSKVQIVDQLPEKTLRFAFLGYANNSFWATVQEGVEKAIEVLGNYNVEIDNISLGNEITAVTFNNAIDACILQGYDGILGIPLLDGTQPGMNKAYEAGIPFIGMVGEPIDSETEMHRLAYIGSNPDIMGTLAGEAMVEWLNEHGYEGKQITYGLFESYLGSSEDYAVDAFNKVLLESYPDAIAVGPYECVDQAEKVYSYAKDMLTAYPEMCCMYVSGGGPTGASRAVEEMGLAGKIAIIYNDDTEENIAYLKSGVTYAICTQGAQQQAFDGFVMLYNYIVGGLEPETNEKGRIDSNMTVLYQEDVLD